jgi:hypothetical protein
MTGIFLEDERLRPIWRFFLSLALLLAALVVSSELVRTIFGLGKVHPSLWVSAFWQSLLGLAAIMAAYKLMTAVFEGRPLGSVGLTFHSCWWRELAHGLAVGAAMLLFAAALERVCGFAHFTFAPHQILRGGFFAFALLAVAATNEETIFRGYPFQRLVESITPAGAVAATSALFGLVHLSNPHRTWISTLNTALVGIPFAIAYLRTRALWMPIGMHFAWNYTLGFILGLPVSGLAFPVSVFSARVQGPTWLTGGAYGPEGGLLAMGAVVLSIAYLLLAKSIYTTEAMKTLVFASGKSPWPEPPITIFPPPSKEVVKRD